MDFGDRKPDRYVAAVAVQSPDLCAVYVPVITVKSIQFYGSVVSDRNSSCIDLENTGLIMAGYLAKSHISPAF